jgi:hypothetical protein
MAGGAVVALDGVVEEHLPVDGDGPFLFVGIDVIIDRIDVIIDRNAVRPDRLG